MSAQDGAQSVPDEFGQGVVYFIRPGTADAVKIGWTSDLPTRLRRLQGSNYATLTVIGQMPGTKADEGRLHNRFRSARIRREWFKLTDEIREFINKLGTSDNVLILKRWRDAPVPTMDELREAMIAAETAYPPQVGGAA